MSVTNLAEKKKELLINGIVDSIREILTADQEAHMAGNVIGGVVASVVDTDGTKQLRPMGNFDECDFFLDGTDMVRNSYYKPIAAKLVELYTEIKNVPVARILFIDVADGKPKRKNSKPILAKASKTPKYFPEFLGFDYMIRFYKENMQDLDTSFEQMVILLYEQLRLIQTREYDLIGFDNVYSTFGRDWKETMSQLPNLLEAQIQWQCSRGSQLTLFDAID